MQLNSSRGIRYKIGFAALATLSLWGFYFFKSGFVRDAVIFGEFVYWSTFSLVVLWGMCLFRCWRLSGLTNTIFCKSTWIGILASGVISVLVFSLVKPEFRVLVDEAALTSTSMMMKNDQTATTLFMVQYQGDQRVPLLQKMDKRPPLFPFAIHLIHFIRGYYLNNAFIVNFLALFALLQVLYLFIVPVLGAWVAISTQLCVAGQPAVYLSATSGGMDLFSSMIMFWTLYWIALALRTEEKTPHRDAWVAFVLSSLVLFSYTRYESLILASVMGSLFWRFSVMGDTSQTTYARLTSRPLLSSPGFSVKLISGWTVVLPVLMIPLCWVLMLLGDASFHEVQAGSAVFSFAYFKNNLKSFLMGMFRPPDHYPNFSIFYGFCCLAGFYLLFRGLFWIKERRTSQIALKAAHPHFRNDPGLSKVLFMAGVTCFLSLVITLFHFFGSYLQANALRLFINFIIFFALLPGIAAGLWIKKNGSPWARGFVFLASWVFFFYALTCRSPEQIFSDIGATRRYKVALDFLENKSKNKVIVVSKFPTEFAILGVSSIDFNTLEKNEKSILTSLRNHAYLAIYIFQDIDRLTLKPRTDEVIKTNYSLRVLTQVNLSSRNDFRISEVQ